MRWCYHCKKPHGLSAFADSRIGVTRKLATCERGRQVRRVNTAIKRVAARNLSAKAKRRCASPDDPSTTTTTTAGVPASRPSTPRPPPGSDLQRLAWQHPGFAPVAFEISAPIHPSAVAGTGKRPFDFVAQLLSAVLGDDRGVWVARTRTRRVLDPAPNALRDVLGRGGRGRGARATRRSIPICSWTPTRSSRASERRRCWTRRGRRPSRPAASSISSWTRRRRPSCPGSVRLHVRSCVPTPPRIRPRTCRWRRCARRCRARECSARGR